MGWMIFHFSKNWTIICLMIVCPWYQHNHHGIGNWTWYIFSQHWSPRKLRRQGSIIQHCCIGQWSEMFMWHTQGQGLYIGSHVCITHQNQNPWEMVARFECEQSKLLHWKQKTERFNPVSKNNDRQNGSGFDEQEPDHWLSHAAAHGKPIKNQTHFSQLQRFDVIWIKWMNKMKWNSVFF